MSWRDLPSPSSASSSHQLPPLSYSSTNASETKYTHYYTPESSLTPQSSLSPLGKFDSALGYDKESSYFDVSSSDQLAVENARGRQTAVYLSPADKQLEAPKVGRLRRKPWFLTALLAGVLAIVVLAIALGVFFGRKAESSRAASSGNSSSVPIHYNTTTSLVTPVPRWNWTDASQKMIGISLGNWLVLERWMAEDWFVAASSEAAVDEWTFSNITGSRAAGLLQQHWDTWISEDDIEQCYQAGINTIRVPTGYWAWIPTIADEPYVAQAGQVDQIEKLLGWAYKRQMYVMLDLHGLPGSQNGEQQSGHTTNDVRFYQPAYQNRSDATLAAALEWISASPYRSVISAIAVCNEPEPNSADNFAVLRSFYERSYTACTNRSDPVPMLFHHGYPTTNHLEYWLDFVTGKDPNYLIFEDHPYPGDFPLQNNTGNILYQVCEDAASYEGYPVPVAVTEWSLVTNVSDVAFQKQFYTQQLTAWSWSAGSVFWSLRANMTSAALATAKATNQLPYSLYSFLDILAAGAITLPSSVNSSAQEFLSELPQGCGAMPGEMWSNETYTSVSAAPTFPIGTVTSTIFPTSSAAA